MVQTDKQIWRLLTKEIHKRAQLFKRMNDMDFRLSGQIISIARELLIKIGNHDNAFFNRIIFQKTMNEYKKLIRPYG